MNISCEHCNAKHFQAERVSNKKNSFHDCCKHGEVILEDLPAPPLILQNLFDGTHELSGHFLHNIRPYNNSFGFASFNANLVNFNNRRPGPYCFKIHGQVYYQMNTSLYAERNDTPSFGQLFIVDQNEASEICCKNNVQLNRDIVDGIETALRDCNLFAQSYRMMHEEIKKTMTENNAEIEPEMQLLFSLKPGMDSRRYNLQSVNEVAAIFTTTADGDIPELYVTVYNKNTKSLQYISSMNPNVEPWIYPLFYLHGTRGWDKNLTCANTNKRVSRAAYIRHRMASRDNNVFLKGGRLFQQWIVDSYVKIEKDRRNFSRNNQKKLRADTYEGLIDHLQRRADDSNNEVGKIVILLSSFTGSPRNMLQHYQDAMAIVRKFGKPDLFITMTCNPNWREIKENLLPNQTAFDRPDIVSRVFTIKKDKLINTIVKEQLFGEVIAYVYVIEYQKRGLPHMHLLVTLKQNYKITTPEIVDKYILAEIPSQSENVILYDIVMKNMIHGPCGNWCKDNNSKCLKGFPKQFCSETIMDENGYPTYRCLNTGQYDRLNEGTTDNQYVVPYNPTLLQLFNCHINVEVVSSIKSVKYLYKYIFKGHDAAAVVITDSSNNTSSLEYNEIKNFIETRYVSPVEACDRIFGRPLQSKSHSILRLPVHLINRHTVTISEEANDDAINEALQKRTMLLEYFDLNRRDPQARQYTYAEIPCQSELFHLRLLLIVVKGATSYDHLRTVNNIVHDIFRSACLALGLIEDDGEWERALTEGEVWMMPQQLRRLFVRILIYCHPVHPNELWEKFKEAMSEDYQKNYPSNEAHKRAYNDIINFLLHEGSNIRNFPEMIQLNEISIETENQANNEMSLQQHKEIGEIAICETEFQTEGYC